VLKKLTHGGKTSFYRNLEEAKRESTGKWVGRQKEKQSAQKKRKTAKLREVYLGQAG